jgi:XTP/dITP diphosphohydrolase
MKKLVFATQNANKVKEINAQIEGILAVQSLNDIGHTAELAEDFETLHENAQQKAIFISETYGIDCFSEDTGLEIEALGGNPGVHTAHYAGTRDATANMQKVLSELEGVTNRTAQFRTIIYLILDGQAHQFEGIVKGTIAPVIANGGQGFGYDPIFIPEGYDVTFADLGMDIKKTISHRAKAVQQLITFLQSIQN